MQFETKTIALKDGRAAILRLPRVEDAAELLHFLKQVSSETSFILKEPEECTLTQEQEIEFIRSRLEAPEALMIVCEVEGRIAGCCGLHRYGRFKNRHRGMLDIAILAEFWNLGIGSAMFRELIAAGKSLGLEQLELSYVEGNERGCALYEKMGFTEIARHPNAFHLRDGSAAAEIFMIKTL